jgi:uncharacterized integral membrane protein (TIGR00698 family)
LALCCLFPLVSSGLALLLGVLFSLALGNPNLPTTSKLSSKFLGYAIIGLGAGMNLELVSQVGLAGIGYTVIGIISTLTIGLFLGRALNTPKATSLLLSVGTAICGGSAIAATAPVIKARPHEVSISLGIVFLLNALALFIFPSIGHYFNLSETQFGLWSALAIHDTSSVVGATMQYGPQALKIGTTVKLARAIWIIPVAAMIAILIKEKESTGPKLKAKKPWFILGFILTAAVVTWVPSLREAGHVVEFGAKRLLVLTLFIIGSNITRETLKSVGIMPLVQGGSLWIITASVTLYSIINGWIQL